MPRQTIATLVEQHDAVQAQTVDGIVALFGAQALMKAAHEESVCEISQVAVSEDQPPWASLPLMQMEARG